MNKKYVKTDYCKNGIYKRDYYFREADFNDDLHAIGDLLPCNPDEIEETDKVHETQDIISMDCKNPSKKSYMEKCNGCEFYKI